MANSSTVSFWHLSLLLEHLPISRLGKLIIIINLKRNYFVANELRLRKIFTAMYTIFSQLTSKKTSNWCRLRDGYNNGSYIRIADHCKYAFHMRYFMGFCNRNRRKHSPTTKVGFDANVSLSFSTNAPHSIKLNRIFSCLSPTLYLFTVDRFSKMRNLFHSLLFCFVLLPLSFFLFPTLWFYLFLFDCVSMVYSTISR